MQLRIYALAPFIREIWPDGQVLKDDHSRDPVADRSSLPRHVYGRILRQACEENVIDRTFDPEVGIIYVTGTGVWDRLSVDRHYAALRAMIEKLRAEGLPIRVLSDVSAAKRQDPELEQRILQHINATFRPSDRFALLAADMPDKAHVRALLGAANFGVFASRIPAEQWLLLDELPLAG